MEKEPTEPDTVGPDRPAIVATGEVAELIGQCPGCELRIRFEVEFGTTGYKVQASHERPGQCEWYASKSTQELVEYAGLKAIPIKVASE